MPFPTPVTTHHHAVYPAISPTNPSLSQKNKVVIVTGASSGIGLAIAEAFAQAGAAHIAILGRTASKLSSASDSLSKSYPSAKVHSFQADTADASAVENAFATLHSTCGAVDVAIANAGYLPQGTIATLEAQEVTKAMSINVQGTLNTAQSFIKHSRAGATFVHLSTGAAHGPFYAPGQGAYVASKVASTRLVEWMAGEHPELRVFNLHPGIVKSDMCAKAGMLEAAEDDAALPAGVAVWMATDKAEWLRGRMIWSHWDVEELEKDYKEKLEREPDYLQIGLRGWPFEGKTTPSPFER